MTGFYAGILGILYVVLSVLVIRGRFKYRVGIGHGGHEALERLIRVHGNFMEYVPLALVLIVLLEMSIYQLWVVHVLGAVLVIGRLLHALGLARSSGVSLARASGVTLTFLVIIVASVYLIMTGFDQVGHHG